MRRRVLRSIILASTGVLLAIPVCAQVRMELGPLHIRIANDAPPPRRHEHRMARPGADFVWIDGYWDRHNDEWVWIDGRWDRPSEHRSRWVKPRYKREGGAWRYEPGHWSHQQLSEGDDYRQWREEHGKRRRDRDSQRSDRHRGRD